ncbi:MAG: hypothetical protein J0I82_33925 [Spirosoma sp.]|nr:DUF5977 domain-containing protein [Spirosoma sp.]MBN8827067.1 hypothetical protein [Spirosoma sp.]
MAFLPLHFSRNRIEHIIDPADTSLADRSGLRYYLEVLVPEFSGSSTFKRLVKMPGSEKPPTTSSGSSVYEGAFYQLDELLDGFLENKKPASGATDMAIISTLTMPYMARETVENNGVLLAASTKAQPNQWLLKAGLSERDFVAWGAVFFTSYMSANRPFLTWQPDNKLVSQQQPEYLAFLLNISPTPATLIRRVRITYRDGSVETVDKGQLSGSQAYQVVCLPCGPTALGLSDQVVRYEVWLADGDRNRISEVRTYTIDRQYRSQERWLLLANSLGGWDTLRLLGEGAETLDTIRTTAELERPAGAPADFAELRVVAVQGTRTLTVSTGYFEQQAAERLRHLDELLLSKEIYLADSRGHQALELLTNTLTDAQDNTDLLARSFTFRLTTPQVNFSTLPAAPAIPARLTAWRGQGVVYMLDSYGKRTGYGRPLKLQKYYPDDNSTFKPITEKPNQPGDADYIPDSFMPEVPAGSTPYPSAAISRPTTFKRSTCTNGDIGDVAIISIAAGKYGSEISQADADSKAEAEYSQLNTQAYADQYGTCNPSPELYTVAVPAGHWHYRANDPTRFAIEWREYETDPILGNTWAIQGQNRPYVFPQFSNDLDLPMTGVWHLNWRMYVYGTPGRNVNVKIWQNGVLRVNQNAAVGIGFTWCYLNVTGIFEPLQINLASGDKLYFKVTQL